ncbi:MAG TPA: dienelactone hydrolase family protein [Bryobacteraceae bacterium]|nr:dienelactone hydrolase family protein [Bryobacteraceae bacterium]
MKSTDQPEREAARLVHLYEDGAFSRRELMDRLARRLGSGAAAVAALEALGLAHLTAETGAAQTAAGCPADVKVPENAPDVDARMIEFQGKAGTIFGHLARPKAQADAPRPAVLVLHENRGLTEHIRDVTRRVARAGYVGLGIDLVSRAGGSYKFTDPEEGAAAYRKTERGAMLEDMLSGLEYLKAQKFVRGDRLGAVGFCAGGGNCFNLAANSKDLTAAVVFYGAPPSPLSALDGMTAALLGIFAEEDARINAQVPALIAALLEKEKRFGIHIYPGTNHAFHNDTGPRYNRAAACDAWANTLEFFNAFLRG